MNSFFVLNTTHPLTTNEQYAGYVIFYKKSKDAAVAETQTNLYSKLIENALKLNLENFLFVDISEQRQRFSGLRKAINIQKCFLFGISENEVGINFDIPLYNLKNVAGIEFLKADAPEILEKEKHLKNQLWKQLQISFKLS